MIKVEIKPVYDEPKLLKEHPDYLERTVKILGVTVFRKKVTPVTGPRGEFELIYRL